jgi:Tfp pilus assembly protein PilO
MKRALAMVSPVSFRWDVSIGNILSILTVVIAVAMAWQSLDSRVSALEDLKADTRSSLAEAAMRVKRLEDERDRTARIEEKLAFIQSALSRLERRLDKDAAK